MIPPEVYCVCMSCEDYSRLDLHSFHCEKGHAQLPGFLFHDGIDYVYNCDSKCEGGAEYSMGKCSSPRRVLVAMSVVEPALLIERAG